MGTNTSDIRVVTGVLFSLLLIISSHNASEARPATASVRGGGGKSAVESRAESFAFLELALQRVLREIACQELTAAELETQFRINSTVTREVKAILKHIDLPVQDGGDTRRPEPPTQQLHFLDFRGSGSHPNCAAGALPRLRLIESAAPVFPAYYMEWACGDGCASVYENVANYELLQRTGTCCDGTADWTTVEATLTHPLRVSKTCSLVNRQA